MVNIIPVSGSTAPIFVVNNDNHINCTLGYQLFHKSQIFEDVEVLTPCILSFFWGGGLLSSTFYENPRKWLKLAIYYAKWKKVAI